MEVFLLRGREHTPRLKAVNRVLAALIERDTCLGSRLSGGAARGGAVCAARAGARAQAAPPPPTGGHEACQQRAGRSRARGSRALCGGCGRTHVCSMWVGAHRHVWRLGGDQAQGAVLAKLKGYSQVTSGVVSRGRRSARREIYITRCVHGDFFRSTRGARMLALGDLDISAQRL